MRFNRRMFTMLSGGGEHLRPWPAIAGAVAERAVPIHGQGMPKDRVDPYKRPGISASRFPMQSFRSEDRPCDQTIAPEPADSVIRPGDSASIAPEPPDTIKTLIPIKEHEVVLGA